MFSFKAGAALLTGLFGLSFLCCGCTKKAYAETAAEKSSVERKIVDQKISDLDLVLSGMNPRAAEFCSNISRNSAEFLGDLEVLLAEEKTFRSDDKSLFFLIDKKHTPMLKNTCRASSVEIPPTINAPKRSRACMAIQ